MNSFNVVIIGAGPSGSVASALLKQKGYSVCVIEKQHFPRFVIGESLLPHCMQFIEEAGMLATLDNSADELNFQRKNGAAFTWGSLYTEIDFTKKFTAGPGITYQVQRDKFDKLLIDEAQKQGVEVRYGHQVVAVDNSGSTVKITVETEEGEVYQLETKFILDGSGYGRVLAKLFDLEIPSCLPERIAYFTHIDDHIDAEEFDRNKILISTHPQYRDVWLWFIPFSNGRTSIGVVGTPARLNREGLNGPEEILKQFTAEIPMLERILVNAQWDNEVPFRSLKGYSANVKTLYGQHYALLGNASEFLDPVFSSGVTIAMHSAKLAVNAIDKQFKGQAVDWEQEYAQALMVGVNAFRTYVTGWYDNSFQDVIYAKDNNPDVKAMISSILAGYAWDSDNPFVAKSERRLASLAEVCGEAHFD